MAKFEVVEQEGMRFVKIGLADETMRVKRPSSPAPARWATGWRDPPQVAAEDLHFRGELLPDLRWARAAPGHMGALLAVSPVGAASQP